MAAEEKNWVSFVHEGLIHFAQTLNPLIVVRVPADDAPEGDIRTELVSQVTSVDQRRYYPRSTIEAIAGERWRSMANSAQKLQQTSRISNLSQAV